MAQGQLEGRAELGKGEEVGLKSQEVVFLWLNALCQRQWAEAGKSIRIGKSLSIVFFGDFFFFYQSAQKWRLVEVRERSVMTLTTEVISKNRHGALDWFPVS